MSGEISLTVVGNLTSDPELRYTQNGVAVANFTIASTARILNKATNDWEDAEAVFLRCSIWRDYAEHVSGSLTKGTRVIAIGNLTQRSYETNEGDKRTAMELHVQEIGPALRYANAEVHRLTNRTAPGEAAPADVWPTPGADLPEFIPTGEEALV